MKRYERPSRPRRSRIRFRICACTETSRAETGSSAISSLGCSISAQPMLTRWRCPPLGSRGYRFR